MIVQLKELKDTFEQARKELGRYKEPMEDLLKLGGCLKAIVDEPNLLFGSFEGAAEYRKFFFEEMAVGALKVLSDTRSRDEKVIY